MFMTSDDGKKYPDFLYWIREELPTIPTKKPKIWEAFRKYAGFLASMSSYLYLGGGSSPTFLRFGFGPTISVRVWDCADDGTPQPKSPGSDTLIQHRQLNRYGFTAPDGSLILIASDLARGVDDPDIGKVTEATVLHELIHWCRFKSGKDVFDEGPPYDFEKEAYGHVVRRTWEACYSPEMYIPKGQN